MARWVLDCSDCNQEFTHTEINEEQRPSFRDPFDWIRDHPVLPEAGVRLECPNCKKVSV